MKKETLAEMIGYADEKMLAESEHPRRIPMVVTASLGAVACAVMVLGFTALFQQGRKGEMRVATDYSSETSDTSSASVADEIDDVQNPPHLSLQRLNEQDGLSKTLVADSVEELYYNEPNFLDPAMKKLPVFYGKAPAMSEEEMNTKLQQIADRMGEKIQRTTYDYYYLDNQENLLEDEQISDPNRAYDITCVNAYLDDKMIGIQPDGTVILKLAIDPNGPGVLTMPHAYGWNVDLEEFSKRYSDGLEQFKGFLSGEKILTRASGVYEIYDDFKEQRKFVEVLGYEASDDPEQLLLNYSWMTIIDNSTVEGNGSVSEIVSYKEQVPLNKIGDYPLISVEEAEQMMKQGKYECACKTLGDLSQYPIVNRNLAYYRWIYDNSDTYYVPYYRFTLEIGQKESGAKEFAVCYVPAISNEQYSYAE